jgi:hypothetical protein
VGVEIGNNRGSVRLTAKEIMSPMVMLGRAIASALALIFSRTPATTWRRSWLWWVSWGHFAQGRDMVRAITRRIWYSAYPRIRRLDAGAGAETSGAGADEGVAGGAPPVGGGDASAQDGAHRPPDRLAAAARVAAAPAL